MRPRTKPTTKNSSNAGSRIVVILLVVSLLASVAMIYEMRQKLQRVQVELDDVLQELVKRIAANNSTQDLKESYSSITDSVTRRLRQELIKINKLERTLISASEETKNVLSLFSAKDASTVSSGSKLYGCEATEMEMKQYLNYTKGVQCPDDWFFIQKLIFFKNCHALPKRQCFVKTSSHRTEPLPFPNSVWNQSSLANENVRWNLHNYLSFEELINRKEGDCKNCFNLTKESTRWRSSFHGTIPMKKVVAMKQGSLRIGLDLGGGTGSFAARMATYNCTILTTAMNTETLGPPDKWRGLPYMETIALRGLVPLHLPHQARLPFFDNTLDIIHTMNTIKYFSLHAFEKLLYDWDRVLRPGGIIWFEMFYAPVSEMPAYVSVIEHFDYKKLYWVFTPKTDAGERAGEHIYLNCVLEKPERP